MLFPAAVLVGAVALIHAPLASLAVIVLNVQSVPSVTLRTCAVAAAGLYNVSVVGALYILT